MIVSLQWWTVVMNWVTVAVILIWATYQTGFNKNQREINRIQTQNIQDLMTTIDLQRRRLDHLDPTTRHEPR